MKSRFACSECGRPFVCPTCGRPYKSAKEVARLIPRKKTEKCGACKKNFAIAVGAAMAKRSDQSKDSTC